MLGEHQVARRVAWLQSALSMLPGLQTESLSSDTLQVTFGTPIQAQRFAEALMAESMPAEADGAGVVLRVEAWYSPADVQALALAVTKVAHYLKLE